jgi:isocitrate dehydrogenase
VSGVIMFRFMGWPVAADLVIRCLELAIEDKNVTYDLDRMFPGSTELMSSEFADAMIERL